MPQIDPQLMRGLMGGTFVPGIDSQQEEENWLNLQAKRLALQRQPRIDALNEQNVASEIENRNVDNRLNQATYDQNVSNAAALRKKDADAIALAAKKDADEKDRLRHASAAMALSEDPSDERLADLVTKGSLNGDEQAAFAAIPMDQRKARARGLMFENMTPTELEAYDTKQSTIANNASEIKKRDADAAAIAEAKQKKMAAFQLWREANGKPDNPVSMIEFDRFVARDPEAGKSAAQKEFEYAKTQGFKGDFQAYQNVEANRHRPVVAGGGVPTSIANRYARPFDEAAKEARTGLEKVDEATALLNSGAVGQAAGTIKFLSSLVSGSGSGVRITNNELDSIAHARGVKDSWNAFWNNVEGKGKLSDTQVNEMRLILSDLRGKIAEKQSMANDALDEINGATTKEAAAAAESKHRRKMQGSGQGSGGASPDVDSVKKKHNITY